MPDKAKLAINSMLGLWANPKSYTFLVKTHEPYLDDTVFEGVKMRRLLKEFSLEEVVLRFEQVSNTSMSTIHSQVIDSEMVVLAKMRRELKRCGLSLRELKKSQSRFVSHPSAQTERGEGHANHAGSYL